MSGNVTPFLDYKNSTDNGENNTASIQPVESGEQLNQATLQRPSENLRQRTEAVRSFATDALFLQNADRKFVITGPGTVTWAGSTTAGQNGIPVLSDVLWILPMLTPGAAQVAPVPPVASAFGTLHLKRASDSMDSILVTSQRRSYAAGDQINIEVSAGTSFSCTLQTEDASAYRRTIKIVAAASTTLGTVITALNGLMPPAPDNTQLVSAALEGGALNSDLVLDTQARQFVSGNYDGEGHTISPANLASFFTSNPSEALAEGDTLCVQFAMLSDTASTGGRRQAIPENSNTSIPAGSFFNSRAHPAKLVNALPICKVVNGALVFSTGVEIPAGSTAAPLSARGAANITYAGGPAWADGTSNPATTIESQLDKIVSDLAASTGSAKIGGAASGTDIAAASLNAQIANLAANWGKLARANTWAELQTLEKGATAGADESFETSGIGKYKRGSRVRKIPPCAGSFEGGQWLNPGTGSGIWQMDTSGDVAMIPLIVEQFERIIKVEFDFAQDPSMTGSAVIALQTGASIGLPVSDTFSLTAGSGSIHGAIITNGGAPLAIDVNDTFNSYYLVITVTGSASSNGIRLGNTALFTTVP